MMFYLGWILFGLVVGVLARFLLPGRDPMGWIGTILVGIGGSFLGGFVANLISGGSPTDFRASSFIGSLLGAMLLLFILRKIKR